MVYVISKNGNALMPCSSIIARLLLRCGKAKVKRREPLTIKLTYDVPEMVRTYTLGVDTGSGVMGFAVSDNFGKIVYRSVVIVRNDIKDKMDQRRMYRINRRSRKTRYRKDRFLNRKNQKRSDRLSPTIRSKIWSCEKEIKFIKSILPIGSIIFEVGRFNYNFMKDDLPLYKNNANLCCKKPNRRYGFEEIKARVRHRDDDTCQICGGKSKDKRLNVHHIVPKRCHGSDKESNLITLCETCHKKLHEGKIKANFSGVKKSKIKHASQMNIIRSQLIKQHPEAQITIGPITTVNRRKLGFIKTTHWLDASIIATRGEMPVFDTDILYIKRHVAKGDYKQTRGKFSEEKITTSKICGFLRYDKVMYRDRMYFIKGRWAKSKYACLMDIYGNSISFNYLPYGYRMPKLKNMKRISARSSQMIWSQKIDSNEIANLKGEI